MAQPMGCPPVSVAAIWSAACCAVLGLAGCRGAADALSRSARRAPLPPLAAQASAASTMLASAGETASSGDQAASRWSAEGWCWSDAVDADGYHWRHQSLEQADDRRACQAEWRRAARSEALATAATALILLARRGSTAARLAAVRWIEEPAVPLSVRRAAAETAFHGAPPEGRARLEGLLRRWAGGGSGPNAGVDPALRVELLRAWAGYVNPRQDAWFRRALEDPAPALRLAALEIMGRRGEGPLPEAAVQRTGDPDPRVRAAAARAIGRAGGAGGLAAVARAVWDHDLTVRLAAIEALGRLGGPAARAALDKLLAAGGETLRAAAARSLARLGDWDAVVRLADDRSWRVRAVVADLLAHGPRDRLASCAGRLVRDRSQEVQLRAVEAISRWPLAEAGPLLLAAMESQAYRTRRAAAERLAEAWGPAGSFPAEADRAVRQAALERLERQWRAEFGGPLTPPAGPTAEPLGQEAPENPPGPPAGERLRQLLERLGSDRVVERREAAQQLADYAARFPLEEADLSQLAAAVAGERDATVWLTLLPLAEQRPGPAAARLASGALQAPASEARRAACGYFEQHGRPDDAACLTPLVDDPDSGVAAAAVRALGGCGDPAAAPRLHPLLAASEPELRAAAAAALARLGDPSGSAALDRFAWDADAAVRRAAARAMGQLGDPLYTPTLRRLLADPQPAVRQAAEQALQRLTPPPRPAAAPPASPD